MTEESNNTHRKVRVTLSYRSCRCFSDNVTDPGIVLPFIYLAVGGPIFMAPLLVSLCHLASTAWQVFLTPFISISRKPKWYVFTGLVGMSSAIAFLGVAAVNIDTAWIILAAFVSVAIFIGLGKASDEIVFNYLMKQTIPREKHGILLFRPVAIGGILTIVITWLLHHAIPDTETLDSHLALLWAGATGYFVVALLASILPDAPPPGPEDDPSPGNRQEGFFSNLRNGLTDSLRVPWFRRFISARLCLLSGELALPFFTIHAASMHADEHGTLGAFVVATNVGLIVSGLIWPRLSQQSLKGVLNTSSALIAVAGVCAIIIDGVPFFHHEVNYAIIFFIAIIANQGISNGRKAYLIKAAPSSKALAYHTATANAVINIIALPYALLLGMLAHLQHVFWPLYLLIGLNLTAILAVLMLLRPDDATVGSTTQ
ncbi:MAG: hypothetical protein OXS28_16410 [Gammaproteobacteria bacterium]|nr:hypothetical protein [Gammaproteobacteria bacterium]